MQRIAWFSPIRNNSNLRGTHVSRLLLPLLSQDTEVEVFVGNEDWESVEKNFAIWRASLPGQSGHNLLPEFVGCPVFHYLNAYLRHQTKRFDAFVFLLEDEPAYEFVRQGMLLWPGVVMAYDLNLSRLEISQINYATTGEELNRKVMKVYGQDAPKLGDWIGRGWSVEVLDRFYPLGTQDLASSQCFVLPNEKLYLASKRLLQDRPHYISPTPVRVSSDQSSRQGRVSYRKELFVSEEAFVVGFGGRYPLEDRYAQCLSAFKMFWNNLGSGQRENVFFVWYVMGEERIEEARQYLDRWFGDTGMEMLRLVALDDDEEISPALAATDIFLGTHVSDMRAGSPFLLWAMAEGVSTVISTGDFGEDLPKNVAWHVPLGEGESETIAAVLQCGLENQAFLRRVGEAGKEYVRVVCDPGSVVLDLKRILVEQRQFLELALNEQELMFDKQRENFVRHLLEKQENEISFPLPPSTPSNAIFANAIFDLWEESERLVRG